MSHIFKVLCALSIVSILFLGCSDDKVTSPKKKPSRALDINRDLAGDVSEEFTVLTEDWNKRAIREAWAEIDAGIMGNLFFKPQMVRGLGAATAAFSCVENGRS